MRFKYIPIVAVLVFSGYGTSAQGATITQEKINAFYQEMKEIQLKDAKDVVSFYDKHMHPKTMTDVTILKNAKGKELDSEILKLDKKEVLDRVNSAHSKNKPVQVDLEIISTEIAPDGQTAKVKQNMYGKFILKVRNSDGEESIAAEQSVLCSDDLIVSSKGIIQIRNSICEIKATLGPVPISPPVIEIRDEPEKPAVPETEIPKSDPSSGSVP